MEGAGVDCHLAAWIIDYLRGCESEHGDPQGTVLFPFLFTLYTSDFRYITDSGLLQKFSDDTAIVGCVTKGNRLEYRGVIITSFVEWCGKKHLQMNTSKTKLMVIDFRRKATQIAPVNI